jgi:hypothetical protein
MMTSAPGDNLSAPTAAIPYDGCPVAMSLRSAAASGNPSACFIRFGCTSPYASTSFSITSGRTRLRIQVEVPATRPSMSNSFAYTRNRTIDIWSSGSLAMSVTTMTRFFST